MKPGVDDQTVGVDRRRRALVDLADRHDPPVADADVGPDAWCAGPVDHGSAGDQNVEHLVASGSASRP